MNVATMVMHPAEAREKLEEYRAGLRRVQHTEWEQAAIAYAAMAKGYPVLVLSAVIANAPRDAKGRPKLAIARADQKQIRYDARWDVENFDSRFNQWRGRKPRDCSIGVPRSEKSAPNGTVGFALVPMVPPDAKRHHALDTHCILWEVEQWADKVIGTQADRDPYLLRRLSPDLFAVIEEWELTDVERAIMAGFRRN